MKMKKWAALAALLLAVGAATGATAEVAVNDHVFFGHYEQDNDLTNGAEAIEWRVLKVENGEALLISQYALDSQPYNEKYAVALWSPNARCARGSIRIFTTRPSTTLESRAS